MLTKVIKRKNEVYFVTKRIEVATYPIKFITVQIEAFKVGISENKKTLGITKMVESDPPYSHLMNI